MENGVEHSRSPQRCPPGLANSSNNRPASDNSAMKRLHEMLEACDSNVDANPSNRASSETIGITHQASNSTELRDEEKHFLLSVERGDIAMVKALLDHAEENNIRKNCVDPLSRNALVIAIQNEHVELLEVLLTYKLTLNDALLHAINEESIDCVRLLLNVTSEKNQKNLTDFLGGVPSSSFTPDITPLILAAHRDNYEIIKILLKRGDHISKPHDPTCNCHDCKLSRQEDSLRHSKARLSAYRALSSPCFIVLSSDDPILTTFELTQELKKLGRMEVEFQDDYKELSRKCSELAVALLDEVRGSGELAIILNHETGSAPLAEGKSGHDSDEPENERMTLKRLRLAIAYKQKKFVSHSHCQQLLAFLWYEGLPGFRSRPVPFQMSMTVGFACLFPVLSLAYLVAPNTFVGSLMRKPFIKFLTHSASYFTFLGFLTLAGLRVEYLANDDLAHRMKARGPPPSVTECIILIYVVGFTWQNIKALWLQGPANFVQNMWNLMEFASNVLYLATFVCRVVAFVRVQNGTVPQQAERQYWNAIDPMLVAESLFAGANIFSTLRLVNLFTVHPQLGPLQISLGRMANDIMKFFFVLVLVIAAFAFGFHQLYWFYAQQRVSICKDVRFNLTQTDEYRYTYDYCIARGRQFSSLFEIVQSLFWHAYGLIDLTTLTLEYDHGFTEFVGKLMFGAYSVIALTVLLNMLIAMMNSSYQIIAEQADEEWKFSRSKLWVSFFSEGGTLPVPFNFIPSSKTCIRMAQKVRRCLACRYSVTGDTMHTWRQSMSVMAHQVNVREATHRGVMQHLVQRYLHRRQQREDRSGVTEDHMNEIKGDISSLRYELLNILQMNGMLTPDYLTSSKLDKHKQLAKRNFNRVSKRGNLRFGTLPTVQPLLVNKSPETGDRPTLPQSHTSPAPTADEGEQLTQRQNSLHSQDSGMGRDIITSWPVQGQGNTPASTFRRRHSSRRYGESLESVLINWDPSRTDLPESGQPAVDPNIPTAPDPTHVSQPPLSASAEYGGIMNLAYEMDSGDNSSIRKKELWKEETDSTPPTSSLSTVETDSKDMNPIVKDCTDSQSHTCYRQRFHYL